ncbi:MAG: response regulator, partial [Anaerolineae bacterium]|nr:response regulator [Anaerolineae bacterium]
VYIMERFLDRENIAYTAVTETTTLESTIEKLHHIDLVLLDLEMPKRDGYQVVEVLKRHLDPDVPIVACTVHTAEVNRTKKLGFSGFIAKPLDMERFPEQISRILSGEPLWETR